MVLGGTNSTVSEGLLKRGLQFLSGASLLAKTTAAWWAGDWE